MGKICTKCGKALPENAIDDLCFECNFWSRHHNNDVKDKDHRCVIANGSHYIIGDEDSKDSFRGFDGAKVSIEFFDGTVIVSTNFWYQGDIPERFRDIMPDNAEIEWL